MPSVRWVASQPAVWLAAVAAAPAARLVRVSGAQVWGPVLLQSQICSWVALVVLPLGSSRHRPEFGFSRWMPPLASFCTTHCWFSHPLQVHSWTLVPLAV